MRKLRVFFSALVFSAATGALALGATADESIVVVGVIATADAQSGVAVVQIGRDTRVGRPGDALTPRVRLVAIDRDTVTIEAAGTQQRLPVGGRVASAEAPASVVPGARYEGIEVKGNKVVVSGALREHILKNDLQSVLMQAAAVPYFNNGRLGGFKLWEIQPESIFQRIGLKDGDLITAINGVELTDVGMAIRILNSLRGENQAEVTLHRDGKDQSILISIN